MKYLIKIKKILIVLFVGSLFANGLFAQDSSKNVFTGSVNYQSLLHYYGRVDSLNSSGFFPVLNLKSNTGFYISSTFIFIKSQYKNLHYTGTLLEGGYRLPENKTITGNLYYTQYLYNVNTVLRQASVKSQTGINTTFNNKILNINLNADVKFSPNNTDFGVSAGVDKLILLKDIIPQFVLAFNPSFFANAGTQKYTTTTANKNIFGVPPAFSTVSQYKQMSILSYEVSMPVVLVRGKFNGYISPAYVLPQNVVNNNGTIDSASQGKNIFYTVMGIGVRL